MLKFWRKAVALRQLRSQKAAIQAEVEEIEARLNPHSPALMWATRDSLLDLVATIGVEVKKLEAEASTQPTWRDKLILMVYGWSVKGRLE